MIVFLCLVLIAALVVWTYTYRQRLEVKRLAAQALEELLAELED